jgi:hypothetical protein
MNLAFGPFARNAFVFHLFHLFHLRRLGILLHTDPLAVRAIFDFSAALEPTRTSAFQFGIP